MNTKSSKHNPPGCMLEINQLRLAKKRASKYDNKKYKQTTVYKINPSVEILDLKWDILSHLDKKNYIPKKKKNMVLVWYDLHSRKVMAEYASSEELLALKVCSENLNIQNIAKQNKIKTSFIQGAVDTAVDKGIIIAPKPKIRRGRGFMKNPPKDLEAAIFTLQWHITHLCDLHCKHCYDRSKRGHLSLEKSKEILCDMETFCRDRFVKGHVCFSGGNPFLYPYFFDIYEKASDLGFSTSILGNPVSKSKLRKIINIQMPEYYQVSLEGLEKHNDFIRGSGNFKKVLEFLHALKEEGVSSAVMLTLTKDNLGQVVPLARLLKKHTDYFTFNRLSPVGEGAKLALPAKTEYIKFLEDYIKAAGSNPIMGYKDNLINIVLEKDEDRLFSGCTGHGCGAAFNFLTVLPDGEVHACRKFPSLIGNIKDSDIQSIYDSNKAEKYRKGTKACYTCRMKHVCGGCMAVASGLGKDIFKEKDPYCFKT